MDRELVSSWILTSCQPCWRRVTSGWSNSVISKMHISNLFSKLSFGQSNPQNQSMQKGSWSGEDDEVGQTDRQTLRQTALTFQWPATPQDSATPERGSWSGEGWWSCRQQGCTPAQTWWWAGCPIARLRHSWKCSAHSPGTVTTLHANTLSGAPWAFHVTMMMWW